MPQARLLVARQHPVGKLAPRGLLDATRDESRITSWFEREPWNVGVANGAGSGIVVIDIDPRHGGNETLAQLEAEHGALPPTWRFLTGGGGEHVVFRHPGVAVKNSAGKIGRGLDVRGDGGYIAVPPSLHISGRAYAISVDHHPDDVTLAPMPRLPRSKEQKSSTPTMETSQRSPRTLPRDQDR